MKKSQVTLQSQYQVYSKGRIRMSLCLYQESVSTATICDLHFVKFYIQMAKNPPTMATKAAMPPFANKEEAAAADGEEAVEEAVEEELPVVELAGVVAEDGALLEPLDADPEWVVAVADAAEAVPDEERVNETE